MIDAAERARLEALYRLSNVGELEELARIAGEVPPSQAIVEVGSWAGGSAAWMGAGAKAGLGARVTCVDIWVDWLSPPENEPIVKGTEARRRFLEVTDPEYVTALQGSSEVVADIWTKPVGLLFVDDGHSWDEIRRDYEAWGRHVVAGGVLAIHDYIPEWNADTWWAEDVTRFVDDVVTPSGSWEPLGVRDWTWLGRRV